ncbi:MAG: hypothetical protein ACRC8O_05760, partial [Plesiomonas shigelloides]
MLDQIIKTSEINFRFKPVIVVRVLARCRIDFRIRIDAYALMHRMMRWRAIIGAIRICVVIRISKQRYRCVVTAL